jgi:hypothetical protein
MSINVSVCVFVVVTVFGTVVVTVIVAVFVIVFVVVIVVEIGTDFVIVIVTVIVCEFVIVVSLLQDVLVVLRHRLLWFVNHAVVLVASRRIGLTVIVFRRRSLTSHTAVRMRVFMVSLASVVLTVVSSMMLLTMMTVVISVCNLFSVV